MPSEVTTTSPTAWSTTPSPSAQARRPPRRQPPGDLHPCRLPSAPSHGQPLPNGHTRITSDQGEPPKRQQYLLLHFSLQLLTLTPWSQAANDTPPPSPPVRQSAQPRRTGGKRTGSRSPTRLATLNISPTPPQATPRSTRWPIGTRQGLDFDGTTLLRLSPSTSAGLGPASTDGHLHRQPSPSSRMTCTSHGGSASGR